MTAISVRLCFVLVMVVAVLTISGCSEMKEQDAIDMASVYATDKGMKVDSYKVSTEETKTTWQIHFTPGGQTKPAPGDFFTVIVDKDSEQATEIIYGK